MDSGIDAVLSQRVADKNAPLGFLCSSAVTHKAQLQHGEGRTAGGEAGTGRMETLEEETEHPFVVWMTTRAWHISNQQNDQTHSKPGGLCLVAQFNYTDSWSTNADALSPQRE